MQDEMVEGSQGCHAIQEAAPNSAIGHPHMMPTSAHEHASLESFEMGMGMEPFHNSMSLGWWDMPAQDALELGSTVQTRETPSWLENFFAVGSLSPSAPFVDLANLTVDGDSGRYCGATAVQHHESPHVKCLHQPSSADKSSDHVLFTSTSAANNARNDHLDETCQTSEKGSPGGSRTSTRSKFEVEIHRSLPHVLMPPLAGDIYVHEIIERARSNAFSRRILLAAPTLADFLVDNPTNVLSADLKRYLEPVRQSRRTAEYLGTYWVSYLLLRWQVNQSAESFERIPPWFRPTEAQMHVSHPIAVDFVAWPSLRDELIKFSASEPEKLHGVLTQIGVFLDLSLESTIAQSFADEAILNRAVCDLRNWKLRDGFFEIYPQWRGICEKSLVEFAAVDEYP